MQKDSYTDQDLDDMEHEEHAHQYTETADSKQDGTRLFKCTECGHIRKVRITKKKNK